MSEPDNNKSNNPVSERRRDDRIDVDLPFLLRDPAGDAEWHCHTLDISPTGVLLEVDEAQAPPPGMIVHAVIQGPTEKGWEHINTRQMRVVRTRDKKTGLTYTDLDSESSP
ncbi:MAG: PilZ domain-containing protein [Gammaproteobacteria bacterium]|nr:PilZ domain-containing protein [Gammaproteobacteria bacterium]NNF60920.1 PilZ domain-containing protein [Gammaproteobacteria bacterium]NNM21902.1 PilZ domain-containing protein [Gammaproteobacteria bacterium]